MKVLFLDDNKYRHEAVRSEISFDAAFTASEAIEKLKANDYEVVFLDHDLGEQENMESGPGTGYEVAQWLAANPKPITLVVLHSLNHAGARNQASVLAAADYRFLYSPFTMLRGRVRAFLDYQLDDGK